LFTFCSQLIAIRRNYRDIFVTGEYSGNDRMLGDLLNLSRVQHGPDRTGDSLPAKTGEPRNRRLGGMPLE
jgi:hypothetical protein